MPPTHVPGSVPVDGGTERAVGHDGGMHAAEFILYVADQARARDWWAATLAIAPSLDVDGMTEFDLGGATLGLMPAAGITALIGDGLRVGDGQRCEVYLRRSDAERLLARAVTAGGTLLAPMAERSWGEAVGYVLDPDGHVLGVARA